MQPNTAQQQSQQVREIVSMTPTLNCLRSCCKLCKWLAQLLLIHCSGVSDVGSTVLVNCSGTVYEPDI